MNQETKKCQNCNQEFTIEPEDFEFYEKIKVPSPTLCPDCRQQRRYAWRNERTLYRRDCDLCGKSTVTIYSPNKPYKVYCPKCWWGDGWDAGEFGQDFDFNRPFFDQFCELQLKVPRIALLTKNSVNSEYANHAGNNKDCYLVFATFNSESILYSTRVLAAKDCCDCLSLNLLGKGTSELCYECVNCEKCYQCQFGYLLRDCMNCFFCFDCRNCSDCILSWNLRNKKYCIKNVQYTKEEYFKKLEELEIDRYSKKKILLDLFSKLILEKALHRSVVFEQVINSSGNFLAYTKNAHYSFNSENVENARYIINGSLGTNECMDCYNFGIKSELSYESHAIVGCYANLFCHLCYDNNSISYCDSCHNSQNLFGCVGIKKGGNMILNKQYTKEEYETLKNKIIEHMKETREYGEFFQASISPFGYNETQGQVHMPMTKEEALSKGFKWEDRVPGTFGKETIKPEDIPDDIKDVPDSITKEVLRCESCTKNYNIVPQELEFYKSENIPIPRLCPDCRYVRRIALHPPRKLWHRKCQCAGEQSDNNIYENITNHSHHEKDHCPNEFETSYSPDRKEIVYCEKCYQNEVV